MPVKRLLDSSFSQSLETQMELEARAIVGQVASVDGQEALALLKSATAIVGY